VEAEQIRACVEEIRKGLERAISDEATRAEAIHAIGELERIAIAAVTHSAIISEQIVSSVTSEHFGAHEEVKIWNRGGLAGTLLVRAGDGIKLAAWLIPEPVIEEIDITGRYARRPKAAEG